MLLTPKRLKSSIIVFIVYRIFCLYNCESCRIYKLYMVLPGDKKLYSVTMHMCLSILLKRCVFVTCYVLAHRLLLQVLYSEIHACHSLSASVSKNIKGRPARMWSWILNCYDFTPSCHGNHWCAVGLPWQPMGLTESTSVFIDMQKAVL